jgi:hypothetical protein
MFVCREDAAREPILVDAPALQLGLDSLRPAVARFAVDIGQARIGGELRVVEASPHTAHGEGWNLPGVVLFELGEQGAAFLLVERPVGFRLDDHAIAEERGAFEAIMSSCCRLEQAKEIPNKCSIDR